MEVLSRLNVFFGIMLVALLLEAAFFSFTDDTITGQAFKVAGLKGEVKEGDEIIITQEIKEHISKANELYLSEDIHEARKEFNKLMEIRVKNGGTLSIGKFTKLLPEPTDMGLREDDEAEAGFFMVDKGGKLIAEKVEGISRVIRNHDAVFLTLLYIFNPDELSAVVLPNRLNKIEYNNKYYYYYRDNNGELKLKQYILFWFDLEVRDINLKKAIMIEKINSMIKERELDILLDTLYIFESDEVKTSVLGRASKVVNELSFI